MKNGLLILVFTLFYLHAAPQKIFVNGFAGISTYEGDLQQSYTTLSQAHPAAGLGLSLEFSDHLTIRGGYTFANVSGDDKKNPKLSYRNLNFTSKINEFHLAVEYILFSLAESKFSPYIFAGIASYHFNPYTKDTAGTKYFLQPLSTEGQGFYENRKQYKLNEVAIPFGGGIKWAVTEDLYIGLETGFRKLFTDYLDDVSSTYADPNLILTNRGAKALELAYRGGEIKAGSAYPTGLLKRGEASRNDIYIFSGVNISFRLHSSETQHYGRRSKSSRRQTGCPVRVY